MSWEIKHFPPQKPSRHRKTSAVKSSSFPPHLLKAEEAFMSFSIRQRLHSSSGGPRTTTATLGFAASQNVDIFTVLIRQSEWVPVFNEPDSWEQRSGRSPFLLNLLFLCCSQCFDLFSSLLPPPSSSSYSADSLLPILIQSSPSLFIWFCVCWICCSPTYFPSHRTWQLVVFTSDSQHEA